MELPLVLASQWRMAVKQVKSCIHRIHGGATYLGTMQPEVHKVTFSIQYHNVILVSFPYKVHTMSSGVHST